MYTCVNQNIKNKIKIQKVKKRTWSSATLMDF